eukprot:3846599-Alexandrium_andersonii.AAC.1
MRFGSSIAIGDQSDMIAVGAHNASAGFGPGDGVVFVYRWNGTTFRQEAQLFPPKPLPSAAFGFS